VRITSYMENIGWPGLFGYDMNDFYADPELALEMHLRQRIFWTDNSEDDTPVSFSIQASTGMYFDMTLFGQKIRHTRDGVPEFDPHPLASDPSLDTVTPFDFHTSGDMPVLIPLYRRMCDIAAGDYGGTIRIDFPHFHRGPLDVYTQMRDYDNFVLEAGENPERVLAFLAFIVAERLRFARERQRFLNAPSLPPTSFVADDWVNVPFVSPRMFRQFAVPMYRQIVANEGPVTGFHTCGNIEAVVLDLLGAFPHITHLEVSGWNDPAELDRIVPPEVGFDLHFINTFVLSAPVDEQRARLETVAQIRRHRRVTLCAQAMVPFPSHEGMLVRLNQFIALAREVLSQAD
jgi:hypothetical protein